MVRRKPTGNPRRRVQTGRTRIRKIQRLQLNHTVTDVEIRVTRQILRNCRKARFATHVKGVDTWKKFVSKPQSPSTSSMRTPMAWKSTRSAMSRLSKFPNKSRTEVNLPMSWWSTSRESNSRWTVELR